MACHIVALLSAAHAMTAHALLGRSLLQARPMLRTCGNRTKHEHMLVWELIACHGVGLQVACCVLHGRRGVRAVHPETVLSCQRGFQGVARYDQGGSVA